MKYNYFQDEKLEYEDIEIPDELLFMVRQTVAADRRKKAAGARVRILKTAGSVAAVCFLCLTIGVNSSYAFAETAVKIPIVKSVAKAVVMRSYREEIIAVYEENKTGSRPKHTPDNSSEEQLAGIDPTESGNDVPKQGETEKQEPAQQESVEVLVGFDAWKAEMTPEKLKEVTKVYTLDMEEQYADTPEKLRTILLAELTDKDISLYGYHEDGELTGAALRVGNTHQYFEWSYMNESGKLPDLMCADIDGDGTEEIIVSLYNGEIQKRVIPREISKENIAAPEEESAVKTEAAEDIEEETTSEDGEEEKTESEQSSVSGNDVTVPTESKKEEFEQPVGELWAVSPRGETWTAVCLSTDDYESQILHQLKAEYDAQTGEIRLYLVEEPFADVLKGPDKLEYEAINLAPARKFTVKKGLFLQFQMEVSLLKEDGEKVYVLLEPELETEISLEGGSLVTGEIKER